MCGPLSFLSTTLNRAIGHCNKQVWLKLFKNIKSQTPFNSLRHTVSTVYFLEIQNILYGKIISTHVIYKYLESMVYLIYQINCIVRITYLDP